MAFISLNNGEQLSAQTSQGCESLCLLSTEEGGSQSVGDGVHGHELTADAVPMR